MSKMPISSAARRPFSWLRPGSRRVAAGALVLLAAIGCGGGGKGANDPASAGADESETAWKDKTRAQRMDWMGLQVFPKMKSAFKELDESRFATFSCQTCHSEEMEMLDYEMPNTKIYALPLANPVESAREYDEKVTEFMVNTVTPRMAELLDMPVYDPETKNGFGCFGCHPSEG